ncbi:MAG: type IV pilus twitching motility protein PilT, partial [Bdellovibrionaceae bacterium]|nr:type IV pilus twitching motility protein PilT [Pseudobdellovibrionaceae bacterium]
MKSTNIETVNVPLVLLECLKRTNGIILFAGNRYSGFEKTFKVISENLKQIKTQSLGTIVLKDNIGYKDLFWNPISYDDLILKPLSETTKNSDCFIFENISKKEEFEAALEMAEDGRLVFVHISTSTISSALHRIFSLFLVQQREHLLWRFLNESFLFYSQVEIEEETKNPVLAGEIVLMTPELKKIILEKGIDQLEEKMRNSSEDSGVVTLNHSLLQLLIRRKISVQKAFEISKDPGDLDLLL